MGNSSECGDPVAVKDPVVQSKDFTYVEEPTDVFARAQNILGALVEDHNMVDKIRKLDDKPIDLPFSQLANTVLNFPDNKLFTKDMTSGYYFDSAKNSYAIVETIEGRDLVWQVNVGEKNEIKEICFGELTEPVLSRMNMKFFYMMVRNPGYWDIQSEEVLIDWKDSEHIQWYEVANLLIRGMKISGEVWNSNGIGVGREVENDLSKQIDMINRSSGDSDIHTTLMGVKDLVDSLDPKIRKFHMNSLENEFGRGIILLDSRNWDVSFIRLGKMLGRSEGAVFEPGKILRRIDEIHLGHLERGEHGLEFVQDHDVVMSEKELS